MKYPTTTEESADSGTPIITLDVDPAISIVGKNTVLVDVVLVFVEFRKLLSSVAEYNDMVDLTASVTICIVVIDVADVVLVLNNDWNT